MNHANSHSRTATSVAVFVIIAFAIVLVSAWHRVNENAERLKVINNVRQVVMGLRNYADSYGRLPPANFVNFEGEPTVSWRGPTAQFSQAGPLLNITLTESWRSDQNRKIRLDKPYMFCFQPSDRGETNILGITWEDTAFGVGSPTLIDADTIVVIEVVNSNHHWLEPGDVAINDLPTDNTPVSVLPEIGDREFVIGFFDAEAWRLSTNVPCALLRQFLLVSEAKKHQREVLLEPYRIGTR